MNARLLPLVGKYYGTKVRVVDDSHEWIFELWNSGNWEPSDRELAGRMTIEQWRANAVIDGDPAKDLVDISDGHFESRETHALAERIVRLLNADTSKVRPHPEIEPGCSECGHKGGVETDMGYACPDCFIRNNGYVPIPNGGGIPAKGQKK